jgi:antagonist of KipI
LFELGKLIPRNNKMLRCDQHNNGLNFAQVIHNCLLLMMLTVIEAGVLTTIQDMGRIGYQAYGVPVSGAMDAFALAVANALVRNERSDAAIEFRSPVTFQSDSPALVAVTGADADVRINGHSMAQWTGIFFRPGSEIEINPKRASGWQYLAVHGGIDVPCVLGSRSTYLRGGFGGLHGGALESGDEIHVGLPRLSDWSSAAGASADAWARRHANRDRILRVILGPHVDRFAGQAIEALQSQEYRLTASADRMGYRLQGTPLARNRDDELISCGVPLGAIQVPADGQPIVLTADHQTTGGYPIIATVIGADIPILAQSAQGDPIRFRVVDVGEAQRALKEMWSILEVGG